VRRHVFWKSPGNRSSPAETPASAGRKILRLGERQVNAQLSEQLQEWKSKEWERIVRRYCESNHDPSAPENKSQLPPAVEKPGIKVRSGQMSWRSFNRYLGVDKNFQHPVELIGRAA
jgi:hypothetical protein